MAPDFTPPPDNGDPVILSKFIGKTRCEVAKDTDHLIRRDPHKVCVARRPVLKRAPTH